MMYTHFSNRHLRATEQMDSDDQKENDKSTLQEFALTFNALFSVFDSTPTGVYAILD